MKKYIIIFIASLFIQTTDAQVLTQFFEDSIPLKLKSNKTRNAIPVISIPPPDVKALLQEDKIWEGMDDAPYYFGKAIETHYTSDDGNWHAVEGGRMCELNFESKGACNIGFTFSELQLAENQNCILFPKTEKMYMGPLLLNKI